MEFKGAFADYVAQHPEIGQAESDISYYQPTNAEGQQLAIQWAESGLLAFNETKSEVKLLPFG
jgi:hypothetical protein